MRAKWRVRSEKRFLQNLKFADAAKQAEMF